MFPNSLMRVASLAGHLIILEPKEMRDLTHSSSLLLKSFRLDPTPVNCRCWASIAPEEEAYEGMV